MKSFVVIKNLYIFKNILCLLHTCFDIVQYESLQPGCGGNVLLMVDHLHPTEPYNVHHSAFDQRLFQSVDR